MRVVVTILAYNEEEMIPLVIERIPRGIIEGNEVVVVVVDDGSEDDTSQAALKAGADVLRKHRRNLGVAKAFATAVGCALDLGADVIVNIDGDNQFNPEEILQLIKPITEGQADVVLGSRFLGKTARGIPILKRIGNLIVSMIVSLFTGQNIRDTQCGFRCFSRRAAKNLRLSGIFTYTQEMVLRSSFSRMRIVEVPVSVQYFKERKSRVVQSIPKYTFKVLGVIMHTVLSHFGKYLLMVGTLTIFMALVFQVILLGM